MIKDGWLPGRSRVTDFAGLRKSARHVVGILRPLIIPLMTGVTRGAHDVVVVVDVAVGTLSRWYGMPARQRKIYLRVIKGSRLPCDGAMTCLAICGESAGDVIRIRGSLKVFLMA